MSYFAILLILILVSDLGWKNRIQNTLSKCTTYLIQYIYEYGPISEPTKRLFAQLNTSYAVLVSSIPIGNFDVKGALKNQLSKISIKYSKSSRPNVWYHINKARCEKKLDVWKSQELTHRPTYLKKYLILKRLAIGDEK